MEKYFPHSFNLSKYLGILIKNGLEIFRDLEGA
jgi:hypothetical protein